MHDIPLIVEMLFIMFATIGVLYTTDRLKQIVGARYA